MDLNALTLLVEILEAGNLGEAARRLKMSRANVSYHLNQLDANARTCPAVAQGSSGTARPCAGCTRVMVKQGGEQRFVGLQAPVLAQRLKCGKRTCFESLEHYGMDIAFTAYGRRVAQ